MAIIYFLKNILRTDHQPLAWIKSAKSSSLLMLWELRITEFDMHCEQRLAEYNYEIYHRAGRLHRNSDACQDIVV